MRLRIFRNFFFKDQSHKPHNRIVTKASNDWYLNRIELRSSEFLAIILCAISKSQPTVQCQHVDYENKGPIDANLSRVRYSPTQHLRHIVRHLPYKWNEMWLHYPLKMELERFIVRAIVWKTKQPLERQTHQVVEVVTKYLLQNTAGNQRKTQTKTPKNSQVCSSVTTLLPALNPAEYALANISTNSALSSWLTPCV